MNAPTAPRNLMTQVTGTLLHASYVYDDTLTLDLYGVIDDDGYAVKTVMIAGTSHDITTLMRGRQLVNMGYWLDLKDGNAAQRVWAERHRHHAAAYTD